MKERDIWTLGGNDKNYAAFRPWPPSHFFSEILTLVREKNNYLDLACGPGTAFVKLQSHFKNMRVASDLSQAFLEQLKLSLSEKDPKIQIIHADGHQIQDHLEKDLKFDLVTCFFPFLTPSPLLWWGLPRRLLQPEAFFAHVCARVLPGGLLVVVNHSVEERDIQRGLFTAARLTPWAATFDDLVGRQGQPLHVFAVRML